MMTLRLKVLALSMSMLLPVQGLGYGDTDGSSDAAQDTTSEKRSLQKKNGASSKESLNHENAETTGNKWFVLSGGVAFVSNYIYRGMTQTFGGPAVQGDLTISQKKEEGLYAGMWGSNVDGTTANNGSGLEIDFYGGYIYKFNKDFSAKFEIRDTRYPGAYNATQSKDSFDMLELIPSVTYQYFTLLVAYQLSNCSGINQNFVQGFFTPLNPNGNTKGSCYVEGSINYPIPGTENKLKLKLLAGYWKIKHYSMLSYAVFGGGINYTIPENYGGLTFSLNASTTNAQKKYYTNINLSQQPKSIAAPVVWVGVSKRF